jgi:Uma2 family endonuclease
LLEHGRLVIDPLMVAVRKMRVRLEDRLELPDNVNSEIIDGEMFVQPRPASRHATANSVLTMRLGPPFRFGDGGPGGWVILAEPELHFANGIDTDVLIPDMAGWRRERMPETPNVAAFTLAPDWLCEVLSPSTARIDRKHKLRVYAREKVAFVWIVDPIVQTLEVLKLAGEVYTIHQVFTHEDLARAEPFDAIELALSDLWAR